MFERGVRGKKGQRIYRTWGDPSKRRFEDDAWEARRQSYLADPEIRERQIVGEIDTDNTDYGAPGGFTAFLKIAWASVWHMGMYSSDPTTARMAMVHTAGEQLGVQRQLSAQQHAQDQAQQQARREQDEAREEAKMRLMAKVLVEELRSPDAQ